MANVTSCAEENSFFGMLGSREQIQKTCINYLSWYHFACLYWRWFMLTPAYHQGLRRQTQPQELQRHCTQPRQLHSVWFTSDRPWGKIPEFWNVVQWCIHFVVTNLNHTTCATTQAGQAYISSCTGSESGAVQCRDGTCINMENLCDGRIDCATGEDEAECRKISELTMAQPVCWKRSNIQISKKPYVDEKHIEVDIK